MKRTLREPGEKPGENLERTWRLPGGYLEKT